MFDTITKDSTILGSQNASALNYFVTTTVMFVVAFYAVEFMLKKALPIVDCALGKSINMFNKNNVSEKKCTYINDLKWKIEKRYAYYFEEKYDNTILNRMLDSSLRCVMVIIRTIVAQEILKNILDRILVRSICYLKGK